MADGGADARCAAGTDGVSLVLPAFSNRSVASGSAQARSRGAGPAVLVIQQRVPAAEVGQRVDPLPLRGGDEF